jgi:hypothetical protein
LLQLPAASQFDPEVSQGLLWAAFQVGSVDAIDTLCQYLPACAAAWECLDPQLFVQRMDAALHDTEAKACHRQYQLREFFWHPSLQHLAKQLLPQLLLSAFAEGCSRKHSTGPQFPAEELQVLLQVPAAEALSTAVVRELMQHSIVRMDGALLPVLVRLPVAAQLQQEDVAELLQAVLGCLGSSIGATAAQAAPSAAAGMTGLQGQHRSLVKDHTQQQQPGLQQQHQLTSGAAQISSARSEPLPELL